jgi:hypothetical protein
MARADVPQAIGGHKLWSRTGCMEEPRVAGGAAWHTDASPSLQPFHLAILRSEMTGAMNLMFH